MRYEFATGDFVRMLVHPEYSRIQISAGRDGRVLVFVNPSITLYYLHTKSQKKQERHGYLQPIRSTKQSRVRKANDNSVKYDTKVGNMEATKLSGSSSKA